MRGNTIWVDVEDIFRFAEAGNRRPQGIQRLSYALCQALQQRLGATGGVRFLRHEGTAESCSVVEWTALADIYGTMTGDAAPPATPAEPIAADALPAPELPPEPPPSAPRTGLRAAAHALLDRLPTDARDRAVRYIGSEIGAMRAFAGLLPIRKRPSQVLPEPASPPEPEPEPPPEPTQPTIPSLVRLADEVAPGDVLLAPGAGFMHIGYGAMVAELKARHALRFGLLLYDLIPLRRPEFTGVPHAVIFKTWLDSTLPLAERVFAISRQVAADVETYAAAEALPLHDRVRPIPLGTGLELAEFATDPQPGGVTARLPEPGSYVLVVATIEVRKNHILLMRVWRRLLEQMPAGTVPTLVFAGRVGWLVADLMQQLENTNYLDGHILRIDHPSDAELEALYRGCLFTLFPSLFEGWGLPVSESLAFGKPCIISDTTSLPEVGGDLARYIDPEDVTGSARVIRATLEDRPGLAAWEARVRREHRPISWNVTAAAVLQGLDELPSADRPVRTQVDRER